jgi:hypothetical protein
MLGIVNKKARFLSVVIHLVAWYICFLPIPLCFSSRPFIAAQYPVDLAGILLSLFCLKDIGWISDYLMSLAPVDICAFMSSFYNS